MASPVFARTMFGCAGNPLIVALGALLLVGCTEEPQELPEHAYTIFGDYWECERGFKRVEGECQPIEVPEHAFLSSNGNDWTCERGFRRVEDECQSVEVSEEASPDLPEHAFVSYGDVWMRGGRSIRSWVGNSLAPRVAGQACIKLDLGNHVGPLGGEAEFIRMACP